MEGTPGKVIEIFTAKRAILLLSLDIAGELERKLSSTKFAARILAIGQTPEQIVNDFRHLAEAVTPISVPPNVIRDHKDRMILEAAVGGRAEYIVSGDKDLIELQIYQGTRIVAPAQFLEILGALYDNPPAG